ncbi:hypothetical protein CORC01_05448 [Colletotrichum orchidophilum]|uniref:Uncharacterized protein n=1 Tax=Colletotrichum orchidophilum TaxID=1209926 RepID=A0A1G4BCS3_9PEZI|nr:uncharacterized protein CORC01_05448 [Colletotrichum orchidophilum]OHE99167.1 hypothetical protein CORC01_05448 [Colletotrichum orchidophilum]
MAFLLFGYNPVPDATPQKAPTKTTHGESAKHTEVGSHGVSIHPPRWLTIRNFIYLVILGLVTTGVVFLADYIRTRTGHEAFIDHSVQLFSPGTPTDGGSKPQYMEVEKTSGRHFTRSSTAATTSTAAFDDTGLEIVFLVTAGTSLVLVELLC